MATTYDIAMKRYNGTDYDTIYPQTKGENLITPPPLTMGGTGATTGADAVKNLIDSLSTITPDGSDLLPLKDASGSTAGSATISSILSLVQGGAKIQIGSYVGTGTYGASNPCSLTFDSKPTLFGIIGCKSEGIGLLPMFSNIAIYDAIAGSMWARWGYSAISSGYTDTMNQIIITTKTDASISWYSGAGERQQFNDDNYTYYYITIT